MSGKGPIPRNRLKTRSGCLRCKQRKIKCDETSPHCNQCTCRGYDCPGYKRPLKWSSKYEIAGRGNGQTSRIEPRIEKWQGSIKKTRSLLPATPTQQKVTKPICTSPTLSDTGFTDHVIRNDASGPAQEGPSDPLPANLDIFHTDTQVDPDNEDSTSFFMQWFDPTTPLPFLFEDDDTRISRHYFTHVCHINSCFDSHQNLFRVEVGNMMGSRPLIYHCVLSMSAAHLSAHPSELAMATLSLDHRTRAISCLTDAIMAAEATEGVSSEGIIEALLASILLGITDGWHTPSHLGITHLHGARILFRRWIQTAPDPTVSRLTSFISGIMAYWEAIASFLVDQPLDAIAYLDQLHNQTDTGPIHPNPWSGICTPVFIYLSKAGTLSRQRSLLQHLPITESTTQIRHQLHASLIAQAREIETAVLQYTVPSLDQIGDTDDVLSPPSHLQQLAQIYRLCTLLELYRSYPELLQDASKDDPLNVADKLLTLATAILSIIQILPRSSGVTCLLTVPLLIAGSTLQSVSYQPPIPSATATKTTTTTSTQTTAPNKSSWDNLATELLHLPSQETMYLYWRGVVRERLSAVHNHVGMALIQRASEILEKVWDRADLRAIMGEVGGGELIQWTEVMVEEKLETILG